MNKTCGTTTTFFEGGERGSSRLKFLIIVSLVIIVAFVGYQYVPVAFQSGLYKTFMQDTVNREWAQGKSSDLIKQQLVKGSAEYGVPPNATMTFEELDGSLKARVQFKRPISMIVYTYEYEFDETVKSSWGNK